MLSKTSEGQPRLGINENISFRVWLKQGFYRLLVRSSKAPPAQSLKRAAIVFSPHQDDETLGCGGTIINKVAAGAKVQVVFMVDGHQSHMHLISPEKLAATRKGEAIAACQVLGIDEANITFLGFPDGHLFKHLDSASDQVAVILEQSEATDIYLPYSGEPTDDHRATHAVIQRALTRQGRAYHLYEYPVWFWHHWPWISLPQRSRQDSWFVLRNTLESFAGLRLLFRFRYRVAVGAVLQQKIAALNEHKSQMTRLINKPGWLTLHDVSKGEFLANLLRDNEFFYHHIYEAVDESN